MKMTPEHYALLKDRLDRNIQEIGLDKILEHRAKHLGDDKALRFRWDLYNAANCWMIPDMAAYYDSHIDTALKHYVKNNPDLN